MRNKLKLKNNDSILDPLVPVVIFLLLIFAIEGWQFKILIGIVLIFVFFAFIKHETYLLVEEKMIIVEKALFKKQKFFISDIKRIEWNETSNPYERNSILLKTGRKNTICGCVNMKEHDMTFLLNEIHDNVDTREIFWNKEMENLPEFVNSKFGKITNGESNGQKTKA